LKVPNETAFDAAEELSRASAFFRHDVDDAADGIRAVESALRPAQHFDPLDIRCQQMGEIKRPVGRSRVARVDAVDEHFRMVRIGAAHEDRARAPGPPLWMMFSPGTSRRMSGTVRCCLPSMSRLVITVTLLAISVAGAATRVATTTT
jgi:hypothetical protein